MSLKVVILSALSANNLSGYDITKSFKGITGLYWTATHQQVYRELARLTTSGHVTFETIHQDDKPDLKRYTITDVGSDWLKSWYHIDNIKTEAVKSNLMTKLMLCETNPTHSFLAQVLAKADELEKDIEALRVIHKYSEENAKTRKDKLVHLARAKNLYDKQTMLIWLGEVCDTITWD